MSDPIEYFINWIVKIFAEISASNSMVADEDNLEGVFKKYWRYINAYIFKFTLKSWMIRKISVF